MDSQGLRGETGPTTPILRCDDESRAASNVCGCSTACVLGEKQGASTWKVFRGHVPPLECIDRERIVVRMVSKSLCLLLASTWPTDRREGSDIGARSYFVCADMAPQMSKTAAAAAVMAGTAFVAPLAQRSAPSAPALRGRTAGQQNTSGALSTVGRRGTLRVKQQCETSLAWTNYVVKS